MTKAQQNYRAQQVLHLHYPIAKDNLLFTTALPSRAAAVICNGTTPWKTRSIWSVFHVVESVIVHYRHVRFTHDLCDLDR